MAARAPATPQRKSTPGTGRVVPYHFGQPDRLPADQLRALESLYEDFAQTLSSSLSAYLRTRTSIGSARIEQVSFAEFSRGASGPFTTFVLRLPAQTSHAILQLSHSALFPIIEILLGAKGQPFAQIGREITEIERCVAAPVLSIIVQEIKCAWKAVCALDVAVEDEAASRQIVTSMPSDQEVIAAGFEVRIGENAGVLNLGLPSGPIRALLDQSLCRKDGAAADDSAKMLRLMQRSQVTAEIRLNGPNMLLRDLLAIEPGDVLTFDHPLRKELEMELNGAVKFSGHIVATGNKRAFQINRESPHEAVEAADLLTQPPDGLAPPNAAAALAHKR